MVDAKSLMQWQERLANTAHQREIADLQAAGLNPVLSAGGSGAAVPSGAIDSVVSTSAKGASKGKPLISELIPDTIAAVGDVVDKLTEKMNSPEMQMNAAITQMIDAITGGNESSAKKSFGERAGEAVKSITSDWSENGQKIGEFLGFDKSDMNQKILGVKAKHLLAGLGAWGTLFKSPKQLVEAYRAKQK